MTEIIASREISAPLERVWNIVSDLDSEARCWQDLHAVYNISSRNSSNVIEREVTVGIRNSTGHRIVEFLFENGNPRERIAEGTEESLVRIDRAVQ